MPIFFNLSMNRLPLTLDSIGNNWKQEFVCRSKGCPHFHWLQTGHGQGAVETSGHKFLLNPGDGLLTAPHIAHHYYKTADIWYTSFLTFSGLLANDIPKICGTDTYLFVPARDAAYFQNWIDQTIRAHLEHSLDDLSLSVRCYDFLLHLSSLHTEHMQTAHPLYIQYIQPVIQKIETEYDGCLSTSLLAECVHITPQYLARLFLRFIGCSVQSYIARFRVTKAKELLATQPYTDIQYISGLCGYNDTSYFISVFKEYTGMTPRQFRRMYGIPKTNGTG